jgi:hypothetical protein
MQKLGVLAVGLTAAATMLLGAGVASASTTSAVVPNNSNQDCAPSIPFNEDVCIVINTDGLYVETITVRNVRDPTGYGYIENLGDSKTHRSPTRLHQGQSWNYHFNRVVRSGDRICGWIGSNPNERACGTVS